MHGSQRESITGNAKNVKTDLKKKEVGGNAERARGAKGKRTEKKGHRAGGEGGRDLQKKRAGI